MNKSILIGTSITLLLVLAITKSLYVDWFELATIIVAITIFSLYYQLMSDQSQNWKQYGITAMMGFVFCYILCSIDLMVDHYLYYLPNGSEDGMSLTLGFKFIEYSDDLLVASVISLLGVFSLTYVLTKSKDYTEMA
ncbi:hypothetical protein ACIQ34_09660 [Ureibacillus sp. NPDC094379]